MNLRQLSFIAFMLCFLFGPTSVWADSVTIDTPYELALGEQDFVLHDDADPFKGSVTLTVTNTGVDLWGDFHFQIPDEYSSVIFRDDEGVSPSMSGVNDYRYIITNDSHNLDFYFYTDPVGQNDSVMFQVYTDNTADQLTSFSMTIAPSPVPLPGAVWLLASGLFGMIGLRKKN